MIFGSYARGPLKSDSDVDVLIVGDPDRDELRDRLEMASLEISRPVHEVVMTRKEMDARRARGDRMIESIDAGTTILVLGSAQAPLLEPDPIGIAIARRMRKGLSAASALLVSDGIQARSYRRLLAAFGERFAKPGRLDPVHHRRLMDAFERRSLADYDPVAELDLADITSAIVAAEAFIQAAADFIETEGA